MRLRAGITAGALVLAAGIASGCGSSGGDGAATSGTVTTGPASTQEPSTAPPAQAPRPSDDNIVFPFSSGGFQYRVTLELGYIRFPISNLCGGTAPPGKTFVEVPYKLQSLQADRVSPIATPLLLLVDVSLYQQHQYTLGAGVAGATTMNGHAIRFSDEPDSCTILHGDYDTSLDGIRPQGVMSGVYESGRTMIETARQPGYILVATEFTGTPLTGPDGAPLAWNLQGEAVDPAIING